MLVLDLDTAYIHVTFIMIFSLNICTSNIYSQAGTKTGCRVILFFFLFFFSSYFKVLCLLSTSFKLL